MNYINDSIKFVLNKYPQFKNKYIKCGTALACLATVPIKELMLHLMYVQNLDPKTNLATKFSNEVKSAFNKIDDFAYEKDFDLKNVAPYYNNLPLLKTESIPSFINSSLIPNSSESLKEKILESFSIDLNKPIVLNEIDNLKIALDSIKKEDAIITSESNVSDKMVKPTKRPKRKCSKKY